MNLNRLGIPLPDKDVFIDVERHVREASSYISKVEAATYYFSVAFAECQVAFSPPKRRFARLASKAGKTGWLHQTVADLDWKIAVIGSVLSCQLEAVVAHAPLTREAFRILAEDVASADYLIKLLDHDPDRAFSELHEIVTAEGKMLARVAWHLAEVEEARNAEDTHADRYAATLNSLLDQAGGVLSLLEAAETLGLTKAGVHKKVKEGRALGFVRDGRMLLPRIQFTEPAAGSPVQLVSGLPETTRLFKQAKEDPVSALQWLTTRHPGLKTTPMAALKAGRAAEVERFARAFLQLDGA